MAGLAGVLNPSFEEPGSGPGEAAHWTFVTFVAGQRIAGFGPDPPRAWEDFERWYELALGFEVGDLVLAFFDPFVEGVEDFSEAWDNDVFLIELPSGQVEACPFGDGSEEGSGVEAFEAGWENDTFATSWDAISSAVAVFADEASEGFEKCWSANQDFVWTWDDATAVVAIFDGGAQHEDFESGFVAAVTV
ncbi:MAG: hypothetical protein V2A73_00565 [Pseudomonadota bacterium]